MKRVITIDGPAASGKSSAAKRLAKHLGWGFVNSGEFYRSMTWAMLKSAVDLDVPVAIVDATEQLKLDGEIVNGLSRVLVDGEVVPVDELSTAEVNDAVSKVARVTEVRDMVVSRLRALADAEPVVMEGRDIGSVVFPETRYKFYVDASEEVRQQRRAAQGLTDQISQRDKADSQRKSSPLMVPDSAVVIDSSEMNLDEVVAAIVERLAAAGFEA